VAGKQASRLAAGAVGCEVFERSRPLAAKPVSEGGTERPQALSQESDTEKRGCASGRNGCGDVRGQLGKRLRRSTTAISLHVLADERVARSGEHSGVDPVGCRTPAVAMAGRSQRQTTETLPDAVTR
jgi:hypothetical protein